MDFHAFMRRYREVAEQHGREIPRGEEAAWGGYLVLADTVSRMIEAAARHVPFREVFLLFGRGILAPARRLETLELFAENVIPRFR